MPYVYASMASLPTYDDYLWWHTVVILNIGANKCTVCLSVHNRSPTEKLSEKSVKTN